MIWLLLLLLRQAFSKVIYTSRCTDEGFDMQPCTCCVRPFLCGERKLTVPLQPEPSQPD